MIQEFQLRVPFLTALLFSVAGWITHGAALIAILIGGLLFILASRLLRWLPSPVGDPLGRILASLVGRPTAVARFAQFTADLLEAQFQVPQALRLAGHCSRDRRLGPAAAQLADELERGGWPASQFVCGALTQTIVFAVSGDLPRTARIRLLREVSKCHGQRAQARLSWSRGVYEPLAIVLIGAVVGWTVLALFMPLVTLINGLS